jgi:hypothetical protein
MAKRAIGNNPSFYPPKTTGNDLGRRAITGYLPNKTVAV